MKRLAEPHPITEQSRDANRALTLDHLSPTAVETGATQAHRSLSISIKSSALKTTIKRQRKTGKSWGALPSLWPKHPAPALGFASMSKQTLLNDEGAVVRIFEFT